MLKKVKKEIKLCDVISNNVLKMKEKIKEVEDKEQEKEQRQKKKQETMNYRIGTEMCLFFIIVKVLIILLFWLTF